MIKYEWTKVEICWRHGPETGRVFLSPAVALFATTYLYNGYMELKERYKNLLKDYRKEMVKCSVLERRYNEKCVESTLEIRDLNIVISDLYKKVNSLSTASTQIDRTS